MKAKIYVPIIVGAGAVAGIIFGVMNLGSHVEKKDLNQSNIAQETTLSDHVETALSEEEKKKQEEQKKKEYEEKEKKEEQSASDRLKKLEEEREKKKEAEEKKRTEEEEKEKNNNDNDEEKEDKEGILNQTPLDNNADPGYMSVPANNSSGYNGQEYSGADDQTQASHTPHQHTWEAVYRTVHHNAATHNEKRKTGSVEYTDCYYYGSPFFSLTTEIEGSSFYQVCKFSNGDLVFETSDINQKKDINYFMSRMKISADDESYTFFTRIEEIKADVTVTDREAYDEKVFDHYICRGCGQTG